MLCGIVYQQYLSSKKTIIYKLEAVIENLGPYGEAIIRLFREIAEENECIQIDIKTPERDKIKRQEKCLLSFYLPTRQQKRPRVFFHLLKF